MHYQKLDCNALTEDNVLRDICYNLSSDIFDGKQGKGKAEVFDYVSRNYE